MLLLIAASLIVTTPESFGPNPHVLFDKRSGIEITIPANWSWQDRIAISKLPLGGKYAGDPIFFCSPFEVLRDGKWTYNTAGSPSMRVYEELVPEKSLSAIATTLKNNMLPDVLTTVTSRFGSNDWVCASYGQGRYHMVQCHALSSAGREFLISFDNSSLNEDGERAFWRLLLSKVRFLKPAAVSKRSLSVVVGE